MRECNRKPGRKTALLSLVALLVAAGPALPQVGGIFAGLDGAWSGAGVIRLSDGSSAPIKCNAAYAVGGGGDHLDQSIDCASPRQSFAFRIQLDASGGEILGSWRELTRQVEGGVSGQGALGKLQLVVRGQGFTAQATVTARAGRQTLVLAANAGGFSSATISLRRGR